MTDNLLLGVRLAVFETLWLAYQDLEQVLLCENNHEWAFYLQWNEPPSAESARGAAALMEQVMSIAREELSPEELPPVVIHSNKPAGQECREVMSERIFRELAAKHAPWR